MSRRNSRRCHARRHVTRLFLERLEDRVVLNAAPVVGDDAYQVVAGKTLSIGLDTSTIAAEAGFNDASGVHSDGTPDSPYEFGVTIDKQGGGEPGWAAPWKVSVSNITPVGDVALEGDGSLFTWPHSSTGVSAFERKLSQSHSGLFTVEQYIRMPANGRFAGLPYTTGSGSRAARTGPQWHAIDGQFKVVDGDGQGSGVLEETGIFVHSLTWHHVVLLMDTNAGTYEFFVDGKKYESPDPLGFVGTPQSLNYVYYEARNEVWMDGLQIRPVQEDGGVLVNDVDADGDPLTATLQFGPRNGVVTLDESGAFRYTPFRGFSGTDTFTYTAGDGALSSTPATVTIVVQPGDEGPVARDDFFSIDEDTPFSVQVLPGAIIAETGFNDFAGINAAPSQGTPYTRGQTLHDQGTSEPGWNANRGWTVSEGGTNGGHQYGQVQSSIRFEGDAALFMEPPVQHIETWVHRPLAKRLIGQFWIEQYIRLPQGGHVASRPFGPDVPGGLPNRIGGQWAAVDGKFQATDGDEGADVTPFTWGPNEWHKVAMLIDSGRQTYDFYIDDQKYYPPDPLEFRGTPTSILEIEYLTRTDVWIDGVRVREVDDPTLLGNDFHTDFKPMSTFIATPPSNGSLLLRPDGAFTYTPRENFTGIDTFTYRVSDGLEFSSPATVSIEVKNTDDDTPVAFGESYQVDEDQQLTVVAAGGVLTNDNEPDGETISAFVVTDVNNGELVLALDGSFVYTPDDDFFGIDTFSYEVRDPQGNSAQATATNYRSRNQRRSNRHQRND